MDVWAAVTVMITALQTLLSERRAPPFTAQDTLRQYTREETSLAYLLSETTTISTVLCNVKHREMSAFRTVPATASSHDPSEQTCLSRAVTDAKG